MKETALGHDHPVVAVTYINLGTLEMYRDNFEKNLEYVSEAVKIYEVPCITVEMRKILILPNIALVE